MSFADVISQVAITTNLQKNIFTDGRFTCCYQKLPALLDEVDRYLRAKAITPETCLALECTNSVPSALTLIYLLQKGYGFMLLPPVSKKEKETSLKPLPRFCQYRLTLKPTTSNDPEIIFRPDEFLSIEQNEQYQIDPNGASQPREKLYLRTSGSMGASKIVVHSHTRLLDNARNCVERFQLTEADRVTIAVPIFHMYGLGAAFLPAIIAGTSVDLQEKTHLLKYLERERQFEPTAAFLTPVLCDMLLQRRGSPRSYKVAVSAGARLKEEIIRAFDDRFGPLINLYGSTELGAVSAPALDEPLEKRATTIGQPMSGVTLEVRPTQTDTKSTTATDPQVGELYCQHPYGYESYINDQGEQISQAETWFRTGDLAKINTNSSTQILGRADNSVNRDGYLVLLADIEKAMEKIDIVGQVVVLTTSNEHKRGQQIVAFCLLNKRVSLDNLQIRAKCFEILPKYAIPDEVRILETLPTLPSGKVDRQALNVMVKINGSVF